MISHKVFSAPSYTNSSDIRGRIDILNSIVNYLVSIDSNWSIINSEMLGTAYTHPSTLYYVILKYKDCDLNVYLAVQGGSGHSLFMSTTPDVSVTSNLGGNSITINRIGEIWQFQAIYLVNQDCSLISLGGIQQDVKFSSTLLRFVGVTVLNYETGDSEAFINVRAGAFATAISSMRNSSIAYNLTSILVPQFSNGNKIRFINASYSNTSYIAKSIYHCSNLQLVSNYTVIRVNGKDYFYWDDKMMEM